MEAVKLGSVTVGLKSKDYAVLIALKRATSELSAHQDKLFIIDDHIGFSIAGLTADARVLRSEIARSHTLNVSSSVSLDFFTVVTCERNVSPIGTRSTPHCLSDGSSPRLETNFKFAPNATTSDHSAWDYS
jgi:20S proteasome subunit alpha 6